MKTGIIGGTGFYDPGLLENEKELMIATPFLIKTSPDGFFQWRL
jgi:purine nucleoside phosphorylase